MARVSGITDLRDKVHRFVCSYCGVKKYTLKLYLRHLYECHQHLPDFKVECIHCPKLYHLVNSLRVHIIRKHPEYHHQEFVQREDQGDTSDLFEGHNSEGVETECDETECDTGNNNETEIERNVFSIGTFTYNFRQQIARFILRLQEEFGLQIRVQDCVVNDLRNILGSFQAALTSNEPNQSDVTRALGSDQFFDDIFFPVKSRYQLNKFCKNNLGLVEPIEVNLGVSDIGGKETFQYIPIVKVLEKIITNKALFTSIINQKTQNKDPNILSDFSDGSIFKDVFRNDTDLLRIHLYCDEFEVVNPLGAKKGKHKVTAFYFVLGNIEPKYRSTLRNIHLVVIARDQFVKKYTYAKILEPLINDLKQLYREGIQVDIEGRLTTFYGVLASISADNLSAHLLGGFRTTFSSGRICRQCVALYSEISHKFEEKNFVQRSIDVHKYHLDSIPSGGSLVYGVVDTCPFNSIEYFETPNSFPPDVMHDFLEGVIPVLIKLLLKEFIKKASFLTLSTFNKALRELPLGNNDSSEKPVELTESLFRKRKSTILPGTASQKLCLFLKLPLIIGQYIPSSNKYWKLYLLSREIADIILAPKIRTNLIGALEADITRFLSEFEELLPGKITPKFHYLVHYPRMIRQFGPLRLLWCMRFEGKHQYFKKLATRLHNFKNVAYSLASHHQMKQCWELSSVDVLKQDSITQGGTPVQFGTLTANVQCAIETFCDIEHTNIDSSEVVWKFTSLELDHVKYRAGTVLVLDLVHEEEIPVFFRITHCVKFRERLLLCGRIASAIHFNEHYHAFVIRDVGNTLVICPGQERDHQTLDIYNDDNGDSIVILNYQPC